MHHGQRRHYESFVGLLDLILLLYKQSWCVSGDSGAVAVIAVAVPVRARAVPGRCTDGTLTCRAKAYQQQEQEQWDKMWWGNSVWDV